MTDRKVTQKQVDRLLDDASYLQKEAEALKYVIESVPYNSKPPDGYSIAELLRLINYAQSDYYRPAFNKALNNKRTTRIEAFTRFKKSFNPDKNADADIKQQLKYLSKNRAAFVNNLDKTSLNDWETVIKKNDGEITLARLIEEMNHYDQVHLKKITSLVQSYHQQKMTEREIKQKQHNPLKEEE